MDRDYAGIAFLPLLALTSLICRRSEKTIERACPSEGLGSRVLKLHVGAYAIRIRLWGTFCCATVSSTLALLSRRVEGGRGPFLGSRTFYMEVSQN